MEGFGGSPTGIVFVYGCNLTLFSQIVLELMMIASLTIDKNIVRK